MEIDRLLRALSAASVLALAACPVAGMHVPAGDFTLSAARATLAAGDTLHLAATLANPGSDTLRLAFAEECAVVFHLRSDPDGAVVEPAAEPRCAGRDTIALAPGETRRIEHRSAVPAGAPRRYTAYAILGEHHVLRRGGRDFKSAHRSNEIEIQVRPR